MTNESQRMEIEAKARHKYECERQSLRVVMQLLENSVTDEELQHLADFLTPSHYQDVIEERNIQSHCGYPLCSHSLSKVPQQKYHICTKTNKVYDITDRKKYCSDACYSSSVHYLSQLSPVPVWSREDLNIKPVTVSQSFTSRTSRGLEVVGTDEFGSDLENVSKQDNDEDHKDIDSCDGSGDEECMSGSLNKLLDDDLSDIESEDENNEKGHNVVYGDNMHFSNKNIQVVEKFPIGLKTGEITEHNVFEQNFNKPRVSDVFNENEKEKSLDAIQKERLNNVETLSIKCVDSQIDECQITDNFNLSKTKTNTDFSNIINEELVKAMDINEYDEDDDDTDQNSKITYLMKLLDNKKGKLKELAEIHDSSNSDNTT